MKKLLLSIMSLMAMNGAMERVYRFRHLGAYLISQLRCKDTTLF